MTFNYEGFDVEYTVNILKKVETGLQAIYANGIFDLKTNEYKAKFIRRGQGPNDLNRPVNIHSLNDSPYFYSITLLL